MIQSRAPIDFSLPRRLDSAGVFVGGLIGIGRFLKATWWSFAFILVKHASLFLTWQFWAIILGLFFVVFVLAYVKYRYFFYFVDVDRGEFVVKHGVLSKSKTVIKFDNILQVQIKQNVIQQALDLYAVEIDSAGSKESEVDLYALNESTATQLKAYLSDLHLDKQEERVGEVGDESLKREVFEDTVFQIPNGHIFLVSLFTNYGQGLALFFAFVLTTLGSIAEHAPIVSTVVDWYEGAEFNLMDLLATMGISLLLVVIVPFFINMVRYFLVYYNFQLRRNDRGNVFMHFGLFHIKDIILSKTKVQTVNRVENPILRLLGLSVVTLRQVVTDIKTDRSAIIMPGINKASMRLLFDVLYTRDIYAGLVENKPKIGLFISRMVRATISCSALCFPAYFSPFFGEGLMMIGVVYLLVAVYNVLYYLKYRLLVSDHVIIKRDGVWDMQDEIIPIYKVVTVSVSQTIIQRISGTGNLELSTPAGFTDVRFFDVKVLQQISNSLLYQIEKN